MARSLLALALAALVLRQTWGCDAHLMQNPSADQFKVGTPVCSPFRLLPRMRRLLHSSMI
jgi:hypothetical protein